MITVVTPTYYRNSCLDRAINSVKEQSFSGEVNHIVVDGSEEEHAESVVSKYDNVTYLTPKPDPGFNKSRELGVLESEDEYIQFLDDDDQLKPTKLEKSLNLMEEGVGLVYCGFEGNVSGEIRLPSPTVSGDVLHQALAMNMFPAVPSTWMVKKSILEDLIPFRHPDGADDEGMHIEIAQLTRYKYVDEPLVIFGQDTEESFNETWDYVNGIERLLEEYENLYSKAPDWVKKSALEKIYRKKAKKHLMEKKWSPFATYNFLQTARHSDNRQVEFIMVAIASLFGRPGIQLGKKIFS